MLNYLSPQIELRHVPTMMKRFTTGTLIAGVYEITGSCTIRCPIQPHSSNLRSSNSINLLMQISGVQIDSLPEPLDFWRRGWQDPITLGFWRNGAGQSKIQTARNFQIIQGIQIVFGIAVFAAIIGCAYGPWIRPNADDTRWRPVMYRLKAMNAFAFIRVGNIHNAKDIGTAIGFIANFVLISTPVKNPNGAHPNKSSTENA